MVVYLYKLAYVPMLAGWPVPSTDLGQYASTSGNRGYCYTELTISSPKDNH